MDFILYAISGAFVGLIVGITGIGGGALMTPLLIFTGIPTNIAIGTDLWFAAITKSSGMIGHSRQNNVNWSIVGLLAAGSVPASIITGQVLKSYFEDFQAYESILTTSLGIMLTLTAAVLFLKLVIKPKAIADNSLVLVNSKQAMLTVLCGIALGTFVTLTSVGAGAFGTAILMVLFPLLAGSKVVGTDIAHAVPLTFTAGLVHLSLGNVDFALLLALITGSVPAIIFGARLTKRIPNGFMQPFLASLLMCLGVYYTLFQH